MTIHPSFILKSMKLLFWIAFVGLCIRTGSLLFSFFISLFVHSMAAQDLYMGLDLSALRNYGTGHYILIVSLLIASTGLKAWAGYWVVKISLEMKIERPFGEKIQTYVSRISRIALWTGAVAMVAAAYSQWLLTRGVAVPVNWEYGETLFFAGVIYFMARIFAVGAEFQTENELIV